MITALNPTHLLTRSELAAVLSGCPANVAAALELLYLTGQRPQELRLCVVGDMMDGRLRSPNLKRKHGSGENRSQRAQRGLLRTDVVSWRWIPLGLVPRAGAVWALLAGNRAEDAPILESPRTPGALVCRSYLTHRWERAWRTSGLRPSQPAPPLYCLRHTRATLLVEAGAKPPAICKLMGWSSIQMAMVYYEASPRVLEQALGASAAMTL